MSDNNPLIVEVTRGDMVESRHRGHCVVADRTGASVHVWGDGDLLIYPRSAIKPLQALALIETGAADACRLSATALHMGEPTKGYSGSDHPVQQRLAAIMEEMGGVDLAASSSGIDGCGIPVIGMPLTALALALACMADGRDLDATRAAACARIIAAMTANPNMIAGPGRFDTIAMTAGCGAFVVKAGAEGVYAGIVPGLGLGVALKIADGAKRAAEVAMAAVLEHLGVLEQMPETPVLNAAQAKVGVIRMGPDWPG